MIEQTHKGFAVNCDFCSTEIIVRAGDRTELEQKIQANGWEMQPGERKREILHRCPCCVEEKNATEAKHAGAINS